MKLNNILIVDDSDFDRNLLVNALLKKTEITIFEAKNENDCFKCLNENNINLILLDIMLPGILGSKILPKVRESFNSLELPIIMVTSKSDPSEIVECLRNGANDYITKPVNFEVAVSRIFTHLKLAELSREMARLKKIEALNAMITTYNHEINNPLTIAIGCLENFELKDDKIAALIKSSLWRIADIVKKIQNVKEKKEIDFEDYSSISQMVKLK